MWKNVTYESRYLDEMCEMTADNYGSEETTAQKEFVLHEYFENPVGDALIELALDNDKNVLAGQYLVTPKLIYSRGKIIRSILSLNTLTREAYRGQGIFTGLAEIIYDRATREGYEFCYGAPNPNSHPGFIKKLSFIDLGYMPLYVKPLKTNQMIKERTEKDWLAKIATVGNAFFRSRDSEDSNIVEVNISNVELMNQFWNAVKDKYPVIGVRDADYLTYRYLKVPIRKYHPFFYIKEGKVIAYAVGRVREVANMTTGMIADFLFLDGYETEAKNLINHLIYIMKENGAGLAGCIMQENASEVRVLKKAGFFRCPEKVLPQPTPIIYRKLNPKFDDSVVKEWKNWFFTTGDYDVV